MLFPDFLVARLAYFRIGELAAGVTWKRGCRLRTGIRFVSVARRGGVRESTRHQ